MHFYFFSLSLLGRSLGGGRGGIEEIISEENRVMPCFIEDQRTNKHDIRLNLVPVQGEIKPLPTYNIIN